MRKKQIAKNYIEEHINFKELKDKINNDPWLKKESVGLLACNGLVINHFNSDFSLDSYEVIMKNSTELEAQDEVLASSNGSC